MAKKKTKAPWWELPVLVIIAVIVWNQWPRENLASAGLAPAAPSLTGLVSNTDNSGPGSDSSGSEPCSPMIRR